MIMKLVKTVYLNLKKENILAKKHKLDLEVVKIQSKKNKLQKQYDEICKVVG